MSVTELPFGSLVAANSFVLGDHTKRSAWVNSFYLPSNANCDYVLRGGLGAVTGGDGVTASLGIGVAGGMHSIQAGGQYGGGAAGIQQLYIDAPVPGLYGPAGPIGFAIPVSTVSPSFPVGSLPLAVLILDEVGRIQQIIDVRPSYLSSAPNLGSGMTEAITDPTKRVYFQNNYYVPRTFSLTPQIPFDLALPASGFFLGAGAVVMSGNNTISAVAKYYSTATNGVADGWGLLAINAINQGYVDPATGAVTIRQVQTSGTFPANSLALFECTTDVVGMIRSLVDWRPSYI